MITFDEAKKIAKKADPTVNTVNEYKSVWVFYNKDIKGDDIETVVRKSNGSIISFSDYAAVTKDPINYKTYSIQEAK